MRGSDRAEPAIDAGQQAIAEPYDDQPHPLARDLGIVPVKRAPQRGFEGTQDRVADARGVGDGLQRQRNERTGRATSSGTITPTAASNSSGANVA
jgi:hypothetical protein